MSDLGLTEGTKLYLNESLCRPYQFLHYKVRMAYKSKNIRNFNYWKGKLTIKMTENDQPIRISHINDLIELGLADEGDIEYFLK